MNLNFNEICRLCLRFCEKYVDLSQTNGVKTLSKELVQKIKFCYLTQIDLSEELPTKVCYECIQVVSFFYIAKKNIIISEQWLRDALIVKKKSKDKTKINGEENVILPDVIGTMKESEQKTSSPIFSSRFSEPLECETNESELHDIELNFNKKSDNYKSNRPLVNLSKEILVYDIDKKVNNLGESDFIDEKKTKLKHSQPIGNEDNELGSLLNNPNNELVLSLMFKDLKRLKYQNKNC